MCPRLGPSSRYVAFLRGINVGGNKIIKMDALRNAFAKMGFRNVSTVLASGNVLFSADTTDFLTLSNKIELGLAKTLGHEVGVIVRSIEQLEDLEAGEPFKKVPVTKETRLYVTFLKEKPPRGRARAAEANGFTILSVTLTEILSVLILSDEHRSVDLMAGLEKVYGRKVTTRNWNTIVRILKAARAS